MLKKLSDLNTLVPAPTIVDDGDGIYHFDYTFTDTGIVLIDADPAATAGLSDADRFLFAVVGPEDFFINVDLSALDTKLNDIQGVGFVTGTHSLVELQTLQFRALGLIHENHFTDTTAYDGFGNLTSARMRLYDTAGNVGSGTGVIATYSLTATYTAAGIMTDLKIVKA